jgi:hypothetical protein
MEGTQEEETANLTLRIPRRLRDAVAEEAKRERRTINAQVTVILEARYSTSSEQ